MIGRRTRPALPLRAVRRLARLARTQAERRRDAGRRTIPEEEPGIALARLFAAPGRASLAPWAATYAALAARTLDHRIDLLGSDWQSLDHGAVSPGIEGIRHDPGPPVRGDPDGAWLAGRVTAANLAPARALWRRVDRGYRPIDWHRDLRSGYRWRPDAWFGDIPIAPAPGADIKLPWELARCQHLPRLALAYAAGGPIESPEALVREFHNQVLDFAAQNPPRFGVNWACPMDVGIRIVNWLVAFDLFRAAGARFDDGFAAVLAAQTRAHATHVFANLEWRNGQGGNHYLANLAALAIVAAYLPADERGDGWRAFAIAELIAEVDHQFRPDGGNGEASTAYHRLAAETVAYATAIVLAREAIASPGLAPAPPALYGSGRAGALVPFPAGFLARLGAMADLTMWSTKPSGRVHQVGDTDSGRFVALVPAIDPSDENLIENALDHRHLVAALGGLVARSETAAFAGPFALETAIVAGLAGGARPAPVPPAVTEVGGEADWRALATTLTAPGWVTRTTPIALPPGVLDETPGRRAFPDFGLYVFRNARLYLAVRCGGIDSQAPNAHAHNDQLALELEVDGEDWIADPGSYVYTPRPALRNAYRAAAAHFVPRLEGCEPARIDRGLFRLVGAVGAEALYFGARGFVGRYRGFAVPLYRVVEFGRGGVTVHDVAPRGVSLAPLPAVPGPASVPFSPGYGRLDD